MDAPIAQLAEVAPLVRVSARRADDTADRVAGHSSNDEAGAVMGPRGHEGIVVAAFEAHQHELFSFLARSMRDDAEAEDLVQETFLRLSREVQAGRTPEHLRAWLYRVATNLATSRRRRRSVVGRWLERFGPTEHEGPPVPSPETRAIGRERVAELERALQALPAGAKMALLLSGEGFSGREIAQAIGRSEAATRTLVCRARMRLRAELEGREP